MYVILLYVAFFWIYVLDVIIPFVNFFNIKLPKWVSHVSLNRAEYYAFGRK